jgi:MFS family permease
MAASVAVISLLVMTIATGTFIGLLTAMVLLGGLLFTIYPVAVARTHDLFEPRDVVPVSAALLMSYSLGATIGPIGASSVMAAVADPRGIFIYFAIVGGTYAFIVFYCRKKDIVRIVPAEEHVDFIPMRSTSPVATAIDPRAEPESDDAGAAEKASVEPPLSN